MQFLKIVEILSHFLITQHFDWKLPISIRAHQTHFGLCKFVKWHLVAFITLCFLHLGGNEIPLIASLKVTLASRAFAIDSGRVSELIIHRAPKSLFLWRKNGRCQKVLWLHFIFLSPHSFNNARKRSKKWNGTEIEKFCFVSKSSPFFCQFLSSL